MASDSNRTDIKKLNRFINQKIKNNLVNNFNLITIRELGYDLSVILEPDLTYNDVYHGLHPKFSEETLKKFISSLKHNDFDSFWIAVKQLKSEFNYMNLILYEDNKNEGIHEITKNTYEKEQLEEALLGKCILQMSTHYGYNIDTKKDEVLFNSVIEFLQSKGIEENIYWSRNYEDLQINLFNIWPSDYIKIFSEKFSFSKVENLIYIQKNSHYEENKLLRDLLEYNDKTWEKSYKLINTDTYYSGVMPCVKKIHYKINQIHSTPTQVFTFKVVRTTYATVDAFDNSLINNHAFLKGSEYGKLVDAFDSYEDELQDTILHYKDEDDDKDSRRVSKDTDYESENINCESEYIKKINEYLKKSLNTHTIAVSSNLVTEDGYLIAAIRGNKSIDSGEIYCSANGQSEFVDENVPFYRRSVYEDLPTMDYFSKSRVDLNNEIQRECISELGITSFDYGWKYNGVSYLSINNKAKYLIRESSKKNYPYEKRRMHFNVLLNNSIPYTFFEVQKAYKSATEYFENKTLIGLKINIHKNKFEFFWQLLLKSYYFIVKNKSEILVLSILFSVILGKTSKNNIDNYFYFELVLFIIYLLILINEKIKKYKMKKDTLFEKNVFMFNNIDIMDSYNKILNTIKLINNNFKLNGIFIVMLYWYVKNLLEDNS